MKNIIGQPARGEDFYPRIKEINKINESLSDANNLQITAPRRVGKTSILWHLLDNDIANRYYVYVDTESIDNEEDFYKKILQEIFRNNKISGSEKLKKAFAEKSNRFFKRVNSVNLFGAAIEFNHEEGQKDYFSQLLNFLIGYAQSEDVELVILVDEFPQTIENIKINDQKAAIAFLQSNRELRLTPELRSIVKFIYTGSIGLNYTVAKLGATATINDLNSIEVGPLERNDAIALFERLLISKKRIPTEEAGDYLLKTIQWYIPFHIQLITQEIISGTSNGDAISAEIVELSINNIINLRHQNHFEHYSSRLKSQFKGDDFKYAEEILKLIAQKDEQTKQEMFDLAVKYNLEDSYKRIIETLMYDGYIHFIEESDSYLFNSPIVKLWWLKFIC